MDWRDCKIGMRVRFGRPNGEKTLGEIVKINPSKAKVRTIEERGRAARVGVVWSVPYSMMTPAPEPPTVSPHPVTEAKLAVDVTVGEYRVMFGPGVTLQAHRDGHWWRKMDGDNLVLALAQEIGRLRAEVVQLENDYAEAGRQ